MPTARSFSSGRPCSRPVVVAAVAGKLFIGGSESAAAVLAQAVAGGAILALVTHAMIPEALHKGGSGIVLPVVGGFLFALISR